ncbi:MAG: hypothetical protein IPJ34_33840 [Myxococcales bacterium]|nr:hypothetical protein [Myxococcales bacterium]
MTELGSPVRHVIAFSAARHDGVTLARVIRAACGADTTGCSAGGVITQGRADEGEHVLGVMAIGGELRATGFLTPTYGERSAEAGRQLAREVQRERTPDALALVVLPDGLTGDCSAFLAGLQEGLPDLPIVGGASADAQRMERTWQLHAGTVVSGGVAAVLLAGPGTVAHGVSHGCSPIGSRKQITRAQDGWVQEIDHRPAWDEVRAYLDGDPQDLNADGIMHLSVGRELSLGGADYTIRTPMLLRKDDGALFFPGGDLTTGDTVHMVMRSPPAITASAATLGDRLARAGDSPWRCSTSTAPAAGSCCSAPRPTRTPSSPCSHGSVARSPGSACTATGRSPRWQGALATTTTRPPCSRCTAHEPDRRAHPRPRGGES